MRRFVLVLAAATVLLAGCAANPFGSERTRGDDEPRFVEPVITSRASAPNVALAAAASLQLGRTIRYDAGYVELDYPGGDVPIETGVCTDVVVRALRERGVDLQVEVHEDMLRAFAEYPDIWGLTKPDKNIDHRRVPNLRTFFERRGKSLPVTKNGGDYQPGDIVTWELAPGRPHTGIVSRELAPAGSRFQIVHNIGRGAELGDFLFTHEITGHYRYF